MKEAPILTAQAMAEFTMTESFSKSYRQRNLAFLAEIHHVDYVDLVKKHMIEIHNKRKAKQ